MTAMADKDQDMMSKDDKKKKKPMDGDKSDKVNTGSDADDKDCSKSEDLAADLRKSEEKILAHLNGNDPALRKSALLAKAQGGKMSDEDNRELIAYLNGKSLDEALSDRVAKSMTLSGDLKKSTDASPFLADMHKASVQSHMTLAKELEKSVSTFNETAFAMASNLALLTKSQAVLLDEIAELKKSHAEVLAQPVGAPRSVGVAPTVRKGADGAVTKLDDAQIKEALMGLFQKSRGDAQVSYGDAITAFDSHGGAHALPEALLQEVEQFIGAQA